MNVWEFLTPIFQQSFLIPLRIFLTLAVMFGCVAFTRVYFHVTGPGVVFAALSVATMQVSPGYTMLIVSWAWMIAMGIDMHTHRVKRDLEWLPDGRLVIYKWLERRPDWRWVVSGDNEEYWFSPSQGSKWDGKKLTADGVPNAMNDRGIWGWYNRQDAEQCHSYQGRYSHLVKLACEGNGYKHTLGARVESAEIIEVLS